MLWHPIGKSRSHRRRLGQDVDTYYHVATTGNDIAGDGSIESPWQTIQHAIDTVPIAGGFNIYVQSGTYTEDNGSGRLVLGRTFLDTVTIRPYPGAAVTVRGPGTTAFSILIANNAQNVTFEGSGGTLAITDNANETICIGGSNISGVANIAFRNLSITNAVAAGSCVTLSGAGVNGFHLTNCTLTANGAGNSDGMRIGGPAAGWLQNLTLTDCTVSSNQYAIEFNSGGRVDGLRVYGGTYTASLDTGAAIGESNMEPTGIVKNLLFQNVTTGGNGRGFDLGGGLGVVMDNVDILNCTCDHGGVGRSGVVINGYVNDLVLDGGTYTGTEVSGRGAIYVVGPTCTNVEIKNADIEASSTGCLGLGVAGTDGLTITGNTCTGEGRGITLQDDVANATVSGNISYAYDFGFRVGHDGTTVYDDDTILVEDNEFYARETAGVVIGSGCTNVTFQDNIVQGGDEAIRFRGAATNANIIVRRNTLARHPSAVAAAVAAVEFSGAREVTFTDNDIATGFPLAIQATQNGALVTQDNTITYNDIEQDGGGVFDFVNANIDDGNTVDYNDYVLTGGADFGDVRATAGIANLAALQAAWVGYNPANNDANSTES